MKSLVIKPFIDKVTEKGYSEGESYESDDSKRIAFLVEEGYLRALPTVATSSAPARKKQVKKNVE